MSFLLASLAFFGFSAPYAAPSSASLMADTGDEACAVDDAECIKRRPSGPIIKR